VRRRPHRQHRLLPFPEGNQVIDLNDFDEAHTGCWEWDLRRLTASIWVLGRDNGATEQDCADAVAHCVVAYRDEVSFLSKQPLLWRAFDRLDVEGLHSSVTEEGLREEIERAAAAARQAHLRPQAAQADRGATTAAHIVDDPPLVTHPDDAEFEALADGLDAYLPTLTPQWRRIVGGYTLVDIAHKVVGVGSVGMRAWVALLVRLPARRRAVPAAQAGAALGAGPLRARRDTPGTSTRASGSWSTSSSCRPSPTRCWAGRRWASTSTTCASTAT
jgi:uncharacterized protein (DUF2252 family)